MDGNVSDWKPHPNWMPQCSVGESVLLYVNDLVSNRVSHVLKFADNTKLYSNDNRSNNYNDWKNK